MAWRLRRNEEETLPTLVAELTASSWCAAVASAARLMPSADNGEGGSFSVRKVQELSLQTVRDLRCHVCLAIVASLFHDSRGGSLLSLGLVVDARAADEGGQACRLQRGAFCKWRRGNVGELARGLGGGGEPARGRRRVPGAAGGARGEAASEPASALIASNEQREAVPPFSSSNLSPWPFPAGFGSYRTSPSLLRPVKRRQLHNQHRCGALRTIDCQFSPVVLALFVFYIHKSSVFNRNSTF